MDVETTYRSYRSYKRIRKSRWFSKAAPLLVTSFGFVASALLIPSNSTKKTDARLFTQGLSIQIDRSSPAFAAMEDTLAEDTQLAQPEVRETVSLAPSHVAEPVALRIVRENRREDSLLAQERSQRLQLLQAVVTPSEQLVATESRIVINHPVQTISRSDLKKLFAPLMAPAVVVPPTRWVASQPPAPSSATTVDGLGKTTLAANGVRGFTGAPSDKVAQQATSAQTACLDNPNEDVHQVVISGPLQFTGGIAITSSNDRVVVYRENDEEKAEPGAVWLKDAKYEIFVDQPVGRLVGELRSVSGEVLGRGYIDLACLGKIQTNKYRVEHVSMTIGPIPHGIAGHVLTAPIASSANPKAKVRPVAGAHVQLGQLPFGTMSGREGQFKEDSLVEGSTVLAHADRPGHWGTMAFVNAGASVDLPMFSDQSMRAVVAASTGSDVVDERKSFIWGRVTRNGLPVAGAKVDLMTSENETRPIYFNAMLLPDPTLKETSANGLYAFFPVDPGSHAVQASDGRSITEPTLFPTDEQTVTQANLELAVTQQAKLRVFDAFKTDWPLAAEVSSAGRKRGAMVPREGEKNVAFTGGDGLLVLDADAGQSYDRVRVIATKHDRRIDFPMIQTVWLDGIRGALRVNQQPMAGTIVGLIRGADTYQVSLEDESIAPTTRVVYFDAHGDITREPYGVRGGGFVILNMPPGFRTVLVKASGTTKALATTILVENRVTNVISKTF